MNKLFLLLLITQQSLAYDNCKSNYQRENECCDYQTSFSGTVTKRLPAKYNACSVGIYPTRQDESFRRFGFGSDGQVMVFLQPGGNKQKANSSQSYLIFPFGNIPSSQVSSNDEIIVTTGSGQKWIFDQKNSLPKKIEGCQIEVSSSFQLQNSGFKIKTCEKHLVIETPIEVGGDYTQYPDKPLIVRDPKGQACGIKNSDLYHFEKTNGPSKEYMDSKGRYHNQYLKFKSNQELAAKLRKSCPSLDLSMLNRDFKEERRATDILEGRDAAK